jgi:uncharacterized protein YjbI with pentapeptide repeats
VRLGGIYALEGVMNTSDQYHQPVLEALCAFVRHATRTDQGDGTPPTDIQAALTVIGRRSDGTGHVDLSGAHIPKAVLNFADLNGTTLFKVDLRGAFLVLANLNGALLDGANLSGGNLIGANLSGASPNGANLRGADLGGANLNGTTLRYADLSGATVSQTQLDKACGTDAKLPPGLTLKPCQNN